MKQLTQRYFAICDEPDACMQCQMIVDDNDILIGFTYKVNNVTGVCEIILFDPMELEFVDGMTQIAESVESSSDLFAEALSKATPGMQTAWMKIIIQNTEGHEDEAE